jgi:hypothetical protein
MTARHDEIVVRREGVHVAERRSFLLAPSTELQEPPVSIENIVIIVVIVLIVLFVLGYFGRGRFGR